MENTKEYIIKTSLKLFLQKNFKEVTLQEIVKATNLSKGAFYHYFSSKEEVFLECVEMFYLSEEVNGNIKFPTHSLQEFLNAMIEHIKKSVNYLKSLVNLDNDYDDEYVNISYFTLIFDAMRKFPTFKDKMKNIYQTDLAQWEDTIENAMQSGEIYSKMNSKNIALIFMNTIDATFINHIVQGNFLTSIDKIQSIWEDFYNQLKR